MDLGHALLLLTAFIPFSVLFFAAWRKKGRRAFLIVSLTSFLLALTTLLCALLPLLLRGGIH
ncbi:MAG: hypothetical protein VB111_06890 [Clostridiaceae bacterium]|nr:hypothetical protein [Clostridiaceae bacterium]